MANSYVLYDGDGSQTQFNVTFSFLSRSHVHVYIGGTETSAFTWLSDTLIDFDSAPASGTDNIKIARTTPTDPIVTFADGSNEVDDDLNNSALQSIYVSEESADKANDAMNLDASSTYWDAGSKKIENVADPTSDQDAATKAYGDANWGGDSATAAATSATDAAASATAAAASATAAAASATAAASSASDAADSATAAAASATEAEANQGSVKVSANDTTPGDLETKLLASGLVGLSTQNDGANETRTVDVPVATQAEAEAGADNTKAMTPLRVAEAIAALGSSSISVAILQDQKADGTNGGSYTSGAWQAHDLNTEMFDPDGIVTISSNQFTPIAGTFLALCQSQAGKLGEARQRLYNATATTEIGMGIATQNNNTDVAEARLTSYYAFTANGTDAYELHVRGSSTRATDGLGQQDTMTLGVETYASIVLIKIA